MWTHIALLLSLLAPARAEPAAHPIQTRPSPDAPGLLLEVRTAAELGLDFGSEVYVSSLTGDERRFRVSGIYRRPADPSTVTLEDHRAIFHLRDLQGLLGARDRVDRFTVALRSDADPAGVSADIERLAYGTDVYPTDRVAAATSETFRVISRFHRALSGITIAGSAIFLLCLVVLKIEERRTEAATLREIGISRRTLFTWTFLETAAMATVGTIVGLGMGWLGSAVVNAYFRAVYSTSLAFARVTPELAGRVTLIALATGAIIGLWAGWRMVRTRPARLRRL